MAARPLDTDRLCLEREDATVGKLSDQIATIEQRLSQLKVRQQRQARRERTLQSQRERRDDTRRKILVGACLLTQIERGAMTQAALLALLDPFLTRADDRHLFGLAGLAAGGSGKGASAPSNGTASVARDTPSVGSPGTRAGRSGS